MANPKSLINAETNNERISKIFARRILYFNLKPHLNSVGLSSQTDKDRRAHIESGHCRQTAKTDKSLSFYHACCQKLHNAGTNIVGIVPSSCENEPHLSTTVTQRKGKRGGKRETEKGKGRKPSVSHNSEGGERKSSFLNGDDKKGAISRSELFYEKPEA